MNDFDNYYNGQFRNDLQGFFATIPDDSKFHEDKEHKQVYSIQYGRLTNEHKHLDFLSTIQDKINFAVALFFTILVDEVCYTHFKSDYPTFRQLTHSVLDPEGGPGGSVLHSFQVGLPNFPTTNTLSKIYWQLFDNVSLSFTPKRHFHHNE